MISPLDRIMIAADIKAHPRTVARVYEGFGNEYSRRRVTEAAQRRGLPLPPGPLDALLEQLAERVAEAVHDRLAEQLAELTGPRSPRLLDRRGIAAALGVGVDSIDKLRKDGLPTVMVVDSPRFDLEECMGWLRGRRAQ